MRLQSSGLRLAALATLIIGLLFMALPIYKAGAIVYGGSVVVDHFVRGFAFVIVGSLVAPSKWRVGIAFALVVIGIGLHFYLQTYSSDEAQWWPLVPGVAGGLAASVIQALKRHEKPS